MLPGLIPFLIGGANTIFKGASAGDGPNPMLIYAAKNKMGMFDPQSPYYAGEADVARMLESLAPYLGGDSAGTGTGTGTGSGSGGGTGTGGGNGMDFDFIMDFLGNYMPNGGNPDPGHQGTDWMDILNTGLDTAGDIFGGGGSSGSGVPNLPGSNATQDDGGLLESLLPWIMLGTGIFGPVFSGIMQSSSSNRAAELMSDAAREAAGLTRQTAQDVLGFQRDVYNQSRADMLPFMERAGRSQDMLGNLLGIPGAAEGTPFAAPAVGLRQTYRGANQGPGPSSLPRATPASPVASPFAQNRPRFRAARF